MAAEGQVTIDVTADFGIKVRAPITEVKLRNPAD